MTDARLALNDTELRATMSPVRRQKLAEATSLESEAMAFRQKGKYREGIERAQRALELRQEVLGKRHIDYARDLKRSCVLAQCTG